MSQIVAVDARQTVLNALPRQAVGIEIGAWKGDFSSRILSVAAPRKLYLVDPWTVSHRETHRNAWYGATNVDQNAMDIIARRVEERFSVEISSGLVEIIRDKSAIVMPRFETGSVDFVYVDGDHSYEAVVHDVAEAVRVTKPGGLICCDDYATSNWWKNSILDAVHECLNAFPLSLELKISNQVVMKRLLDK